jgi:hypothetical protein
VDSEDATKLSEIARDIVAGQVAGDLPDDPVGGGDAGTGDAGTGDAG